MKGNDWIIVAIAAVLLYILWEHERTRGQPLTSVVPQYPNGIPPAPGAGTASGATVSLPAPSSGLTGASKTAATITQTAEAIASAQTHVPLATVGAAAQRSPTWAKVLAPTFFFPTSSVQSFINNPIGSAKGAAQTIGHDIAHPVDTVKSAGKAIGSAASSIGHALGSLF